MSWGTELWDQYDKISAHTDQGIEFVKRVSAFVEKRIHAEQSYAKDLRKLVKGFVRKDDQDSNYSAMKSFSKMIHEVNDLAGQRELISEYMEAEVLTPLKTLARDVATERRKHLATGTELHRQLKASMDMLERTKKQYEKASEEAESAQHKLERADNDPNSTKAKIDQFTTTLRQKEQTAEECRNNYILQLERTNGFRSQHFNTSMPALFTEVEGMNERRINKYKELLATFAECHRRVSPVVNTCLDNITGASDFIDAEKDNKQLISDTKTGFPIPGDVDFEEYQGKQFKKNKKTPAKVEPREDYSHLPPEQRRKKLQHKVHSLEATLNKALSDKKAMEKMQTIYTQNSKLGDPNAVAQSLVQNEAKITESNAELDKFKSWLAEAHEQINAEPPKPTKPTGRFHSSKAAASPKPTKADKKKGKDKGVSDNQNGSSPTDFSPEDDPNNKKQLAEPRGASPPTAGHSKGEWSSDEDDDDTEAVAGRVLYNFDGQNEDELSVQAEDQVVILEDLGDGWLRVRSRQEEGYVPESYVKVLGVTQS